MEKQKIAFFDIDGVLANDTHRVHHALNRGWTSYFKPSTVALDPVWPQGREKVIEMQEQGYIIAYLTGRRNDELRQTTEDWLDDNCFPVGRLVMRNYNQTVGYPLARFKADYIAWIVDSNNFGDVVLFDDDPEVIRVVNEFVGPDVARHCTWHIKQKALVRKAIA